MIEGFKPDILVWGSDAMDMGIISKHARNCKLPSVDDELQDEKKKRSALKQVAPDASMWWLQDNHTTERYSKYVWNNAPKIADLEAVQFHSVIDWPAKRIISEYQAGDTLRVIHGSYVVQAPGASVLKEMMSPANRRGRIIRSVMSGHVHRWAHISLDNGLEGLECGTLQNLNPQYMRDLRQNTNWSHGMGFAIFGKDWSRIIPARFVVKRSHLTTVVEGQEYRVKLGPSYSG